jgi:hypothetical protein
MYYRQMLMLLSLDSEKNAEQRKMMTMSFLRDSFIALNLSNYVREIKILTL